MNVSAEVWQYIAWAVGLQMETAAMRDDQAEWGWKLARAMPNHAVPWWPATMSLC